MSVDISKFYHIKVPGDGDCLFHSLSGILDLEDNIKHYGSHTYTFQNKNKKDTKFYQYPENSSS